MLRKNYPPPPHINAPTTTWMYQINVMKTLLVFMEPWPTYVWVVIWDIIFPNRLHSQQTSLLPSLVQQTFVKSTFNWGMIFKAPKLDPCHTCIKVVAIWHPIHHEMTGMTCCHVNVVIQVRWSCHLDTTLVLVFRGMLSCEQWGMSSNMWAVRKVRYLEIGPLVSYNRGILV